MTLRSSARFTRVGMVFFLLIMAAVITPSALAQRASLSTSSLSFGNVTVGSSSAAKTVRLSNSSSVVLSVSGITVSGDYAQTNNCGRAVPARGSCTISVTFKPKATGKRTGTLRITDNAPNSPQTVGLSGTGTAPVVPATVTPSSLTFGTQNVGTISSAQTVTLKNNQSVALGISSITTTGDFTQTNNCGTQRPAGASCTISVRFQPSTSGARTGSLAIAVNAGPSPLTVALTGTGAATVAPSLVSISLPLGFVQLFKGTSYRYVATGTYSDGTSKDISTTVAWSSSNPAVAPVGNTTPEWGLARAMSPGTVTISAAAPGASGTVTATSTLQVLPAKLVSVVVSPVNASMATGTTLQFSATGTYTDGTVADVTQSATWSASTGVSISNASGSRGVATASAAGAATVTAAVYSGVAGACSMGCGYIYASTNVTVTAAVGCATPTLDMKLLVVNNSANNYQVFPAIRQVLDYVGTPYDVVDVSTGIDPAMLSDGACHGHYQGVIFAYGNDIYHLPGMTDLTAYEKKFQVRQVNWYAYPETDFGLNTYNAIIGSDVTFTANFTPAGAAVFTHANTNNPLSFTRSYTFLATPIAPGSGSVTPLLVDSAGNALSLIYNMGDGREYLTQTFDSNAEVTHNLVLAYGLVNWVTKGIFLGEYHVYSTPQVDDIFIQNDEWQSNTPCPNSAALPQFRLLGSDFAATVNWQNEKQQNPLLSNFTLHFAFVGSGATGDPNQGGFNPDTLTPEVLLLKDEFKWISHTWSHKNLNAADATLVHNELTLNNAEANTLGLPGYNPANLVTPQISGLNNAAFVNQAVADGVRYVVSDTSVWGQPNNGTNPTPNVGLVNSINPLLYEVPRHATNLFYNVGTPDDWASEYHCIFAGNYPYDTYSYEQIRDDISRSLLSHMLKGDMDPLMFHMSNVHAYDGSHSLLSDVYDQTFSSYLGLLKLPVLSPTLDQLGQSMQARDRYNQSGVQATLTSGATPTITVVVPSGSAVSSATIPITGLNSAGAEVYGGHYISHVEVNRGEAVTLPVL